MRVAFIGLGRLGLPIAAVLSQHHRVTGYDPDPTTAARLKVGHPWEAGLSEFLNDRIALTTSIDSACFDADVAVVCVQTPHAPELDGTHDTDERAPFDLSYVRAALAEIPEELPVVLMSTVLPGDCRTLGRDNLIYAPAFPAMGTTIEDFLNPEFALTGSAHPRQGDDTPYLELMATIYGWRFDRYGPETEWALNGGVRLCSESWETAELAKMAYNTAIGAKISLANTVGWLAEKVGADGGQVMRILGNAHRRITSPAYFQPGLGDGGACHPRDQVALSWLARSHEVYDLFGDLIAHRSAHSAWIAEVAERHADGREIVILGSAYKANSTLTDGSPALLLANQTGWPIVERPPTEPACVVIGVPHDSYKTLDLSKHVVVDPWGVVPGAIHPGRSPLR